MYFEWSSIECRFSYSKLNSSRHYRFRIFKDWEKTYRSIFRFLGTSIKKAAIAISTGVALILLDIIGFKSDENNGKNILFAVSFIYAGLPIILKMFSIYLMWNFKLDKKTHSEILEKIKT